MKNKYKNITKVCLAIASVFAITACSKKKNTTAKQTTASNVTTTSKQTTKSNVTTTSKQTTKSNVTTASKQTTAHVHSYGEWSIITDATCTTDGSKKRTCSCGDEINEPILATGHTAVIDYGEKAKCTEQGKTDGYHCSVCNITLLERKDIPKTGHTYAIDARVDATCITTGLTEGKHCSVCETVLIEQKEIPAIGHVIENNECTNCDYYIYKMIDEKSLYFGYYPQTKESDETTIETLNTTAGTLPTSGNTNNWTDYGYYINGIVESYMYYIDIDLDSDGRFDYRGVYFTKYRPYDTNEVSSTKRTYQYRNEYYINTVYWFKYEPIKWNILKTDEGKALIISELSLDSQDYFYKSQSDEFEHNGGEGYTNNYELSHIRQWLNDEFYNTSFNDLEKAVINTTLVDNSDSTTANNPNNYACDETNDKILLLSYQETEIYYRYSKKMAQGTDYAKSQGLGISEDTSYLGNSYWWLRSPIGANYCYVSVVDDKGYNNSGLNARSTDIGVLPVCWINL